MPKAIVLLYAFAALNAWSQGVPFSLTPPSGWQAQPPPNPTIFIHYIGTPGTAAFKPNVNVAVAPAKAGTMKFSTPKEIGDNLINAQLRMFPLFKLLDRREQAVDGKPGVSLPP